MTKINIDREKAISLMRTAVEQRGEDFTYTIQEGAGGVCLYWHEEQEEPGCIVGLALSLAGVSNETLAAFDAVEANEEGTSIYALERSGRLADAGVIVTGSAIEAFRRAQRAQDAGGTWGAGLHRAEEAAI